MSKKKILGLLVAGAIVVSTIGGSFAWFTSQDSIVNKFATQSIDPKDPNPKNGVAVYEKFDPLVAKKSLPGTKVDKQVQAKNTATYDQFIRVKITPAFTATPNISQGATPDNSLIQLGFNPANLGSMATIATDSGKWIQDPVHLDTYYYLGKVAPKAFTKELLSSVTLSKLAGNDYKGAEYDVTVDVKAVQASNDAVADEFQGADKDIINALKAMQDPTVAAVADAKLINGATTPAGTNIKPQP